MSRLGINVPDELLERLQPFKSSINVSQICRDAIEAQVAAYERAMTRVDSDGFDDMIQRLREEYIDREIDWESLGHEDAKVWAELASLSDFETLFYRLKFVGHRGMLQKASIDIIPFIEGAKRFYDHEQEHKEWLLERTEYDEGPNHFEQAKAVYELGWFSYIRAVWQKVQPALAKDQEGAQR